MAHPKTLQVFLMDGAPTGRLKCTLDNWTGLVYVVPRTSLNADGHPEAFEGTGVYPVSYTHLTLPTNREV